MTHDPSAKGPQRGPCDGHIMSLWSPHVTALMSLQGDPPPGAAAMEGTLVLSPSWWEKRRAWARQSRSWRPTAPDEDDVAPNEDDVAPDEDEVAPATRHVPELPAPDLDDVFLEGHWSPGGADGTGVSPVLRHLMGVCVPPHPRKPLQEDRDVAAGVWVSWGGRWCHCGGTTPTPPWPFLEAVGASRTVASVSPPLPLNPR